MLGHHGVSVCAAYCTYSYPEPTPDGRLTIWGEGGNRVFRKKNSLCHEIKITKHKYEFAIIKKVFLPSSLKLSEKLIE